MEICIVLVEKVVTKAFEWVTCGLTLRQTFENKTFYLPFFSGESKGSGLKRIAVKCCRFSSVEHCFCGKVFPLRVDFTFGRNKNSSFYKITRTKPSKLWSGNFVKKLYWKRSCFLWLDVNKKLPNPFFKRCRQKDWNVYYLSQTYFDFPRRTIGNNSIIRILFEQQFKNAENF